MRKNNLIIIIAIFILGIIGVFVTSIMVFLLSKDYGDFSIFKDSLKDVYQETYNIDEFDNVHINVRSSDVYIEESDINQVRVEIYGKESSGTSMIDNHTLEIKKNSSHEMCFGFCFIYRDEIHLYLPKDFMKKVSVQSNSGDVEVKDFAKLDLNVITSSGDIAVHSVRSLNAKTSSGDVDVRSIFKEVDINTSSGDVTVDSLSILNDSSIATHSGDVSISSIGDCYVDTHTNSGDIDIKNNNRFASITLNVQTRSGDIDIK